ncbi:MAG: bifunctional 3'-5' exonuclease/DNA polymerase [Actinophytocola sp.]|uniref:bifunctional 3'-5' exonuclease/DNA polymerase n=1 Tax=Actinophytocola sp. TaxID=1872138 RepID=UPI0013251D1D|nr:bifunctional 3'-5' exonuclease/DNA polymerase [Actinophytocola sp.]MPZ79636.1 bifunctional 3'-5' exonuclease/DNA polymerase [Actinophytocola sp.]
MQVVVVPEDDGAGRVRVLPDGADPGAPEKVDDLAGWMAATEAARAPRWVLPSAEALYPDLLEAGVRLSRCHDLYLTEGILLAFAGLPGRPRNLAAAWARMHDLPEPDDPPPVSRTEQPALFEADRGPLPAGADPLDAAVAVHTHQQRQIDETPQPERLRLLVAAESAGALAAAEMRHHGLPWRTDVHLALLAEMLGPRPTSGARPKVLAGLAEEITGAFGLVGAPESRQVNPDNPASVVRAFARAGIDVPSSRAHVLKEVDHPAVEPLLRYKELARLWVANGWSWLDSWVHGGRFRPEYVVGGVVSGRWATRGGAALQLPRALRTAVRADPGWKLVVADASQLEPRVLGALSGDNRFAEVSAATDLYTTIAADTFDGNRDHAKRAMLSAMYGGTAGGAGPLLAQLRKRFPQAVDYVEQAARAGEEGRMVRSRLGRTSPPPSESWRALMGSADPGTEQRSREAARNWGRFTRNFVVQASAADWALTVLATLRRRLAGTEAQLVFFQHDEVLVHCPEPIAAEVATEVSASADEASHLVFPDTPVRFPLQAAVVDCYADAK